MTYSIVLRRKDGKVVVRRGLDMDDAKKLLMNCQRRGITALWTITKEN